MPEMISAKQLREQLQDLESDSLYQAPAVGASESGGAATRHDEVLYR